MQDATLAHFSGYTEDEIKPVFDLMLDYLHGPVAHEAFFKKYASKKFLKGKLVVPVKIQLRLTAVIASIRCRKWAKDMYAVQNDGGGVAIGDIKSPQ